MTLRRSQPVEQASARLEHYLIQVPAAGYILCPICHGPVYDGYTTCYPCNETLRALGSLALDAVGFVSLAPAKEQMARDLYTYKLAKVQAELRRGRAVGLSAALWRWLSVHERCLAVAAGISDFHIITTVPSTSGRKGEHPLSVVVGKIVEGSGERVRDLLSLNRTDLQPREPAADRFIATHDVAGRNVLIIDDTWTTGSKIQAASAALKQAGARGVGGLAIGRWLTPDYRENESCIHSAVF